MYLAKTPKPGPMILAIGSQLWRVRLVLPYEHWHGRD